VTRLARGPVEERPQDDAAATYAPRLTREDGAIDWHQSATAIHNRIRGLRPWPHAHSHLNGRRYILLRSHVAEDATAQPPGTILVAAHDQLIVATGSGTLRLVEIQPEGKRPMAVREFLAGHPVETGAVFA
jgi:methionyl-tRNA formyltransferase